MIDAATCKTQENPEYESILKIDAPDMYRG